MGLVFAAERKRRKKSAFSWGLPPNFWKGLCTHAVVPRLLEALLLPSLDSAAVRSVLVGPKGHAQTQNPRLRILNRKKTLEHTLRVERGRECDFVKLMSWLKYCAAHEYDVMEPEYCPSCGQV